MAVKVVDYSWSKIIERDAYAKQALNDKIIEVLQLEDSVRANEGSEVARVVFKDGLIVHALKRCLENLEGASTVTEQDFWVCYEFATTAAKNAEELMNEDEE